MYLNKVVFVNGCMILRYIIFVLSIEDKFVLFVFELRRIIVIYYNVYKSDIGMINVINVSIRVFFIYCEEDLIFVWRR